MQMWGIVSGSNHFRKSLLLAPLDLSVAGKIQASMLLQTCLAAAGAPGGFLSLASLMGDPAAGKSCCCC
jgi:hypothetical protein